MAPDYDATCHLTSKKPRAEGAPLLGLPLLLSPPQGTEATIVWPKHAIP